MPRKRSPNPRRSAPGFRWACPRPGRGEAPIADEAVGLSQVAAAYDVPPENWSSMRRKHPAAVSRGTGCRRQCISGEIAVARYWWRRFVRTHVAAVARCNPPGDDAEEKPDGVDIPRFLGRQNSQ